MFKFLQRRRDERKDDQATLSELVDPYFGSHEYQDLIDDRLRRAFLALPPVCEKHLWRVNRHSSKRQYYPWMIFFVCERCMKDMAMARKDVYEFMGIHDLDFRVLIATNTQVFINEIEQAKTILRSERN